MSIENTRSVIKAYLGEHDRERIAEDAIYTLMATGEETHGREAIGQMMAYFYQNAFQASFEGTNTILGEDNAVIEGHLVGKHTGEFAGVPATGKDVRVPMCIVYDVEGPHIQRARIYMQMSVLMAQLGVSPS